MFIIRDNQSGLLFHKKQQIILFERPEDAQSFLQAFHQYAIQRMLEETQDPTSIFTVQNKLMHCEILQPPFDVNNVKTIWFHEL